MERGVQGALIAVFLFTFSGPALADEIVSLKAGYMTLSPSGEIASEIGGVGSKVDLEDDLGVDDSDNMTAEAAFSLGNFTLTAGYLPLSFEGDSTLSRTIVFDGQIYRSGSRVASSVDMDILDIGLTYYFLNLDDAPTRIQLGLELATKVTDARAEITDLTFGITESADETLPLPTIGLRGRVAFSDFVGLVGRLGYMGYSDNHFLDADIQVELSPLPMIGVYAGYRHIDISIDESDFFADVEFSGFYGGALFRF